MTEQEGPDTLTELYRYSRDRGSGHITSVTFAIVGKLALLDTQEDYYHD